LKPNETAKTVVVQRTDRPAAAATAFGDTAEAGCSTLVAVPNGMIEVAISST